ncbi:MAG: radical SAM protein [Candidatus Omnitrophica bacterium]|jgi:radical SAM superfamily enzyme YgiQ (UPF0313 family)|nr:radical SAM protein [Candidatus Omnitrophota bacterium]
MKIIISYPPLQNKCGFPTLGQNRQFQYFKEPTFIYPVVPAQAATLLHRAGHQVIWNDSIACGLDTGSYFTFLEAVQPDLILFETKTPVIRQHWEIINQIKAFPWRKTAPKLVLCGDHVTALPEESFENSGVDFVLTGGDYDFLLLNLCDCLKNLDKTSLQPGIYYRENGSILNSGKFELDHDLNSLPFIDRDLTDYKLYAYKNGNFKAVPGTYIMSGRDCWHHECTFCSWPTLYPTFRARSADNVIEEIDQLVEKYRIREIMDDTGCFPAGDWLDDFCRLAINRQYQSRKIYLDCNMRFGALSYNDFVMMKDAGFRLLLFGLESANQNTLDRLKKKVKLEQVIEDCKSATRAGLFPHITIMFGYPWESYQDAQKTLDLGKYLLKKGYAHTMQATIVIPYPGTELFRCCCEEKLLHTLDWNDYDMKHPVMKTNIPDKKIAQLVRGMYNISFDSEFLLRKLSSVKDFDDFRYYLRAARKIFGHLFDFRR